MFVFKCFILAWQGVQSSADLGMVARLATSESPGLFISYMFFSSKHRDSDSLSLEWNLGIYVSISDYEASLENIVY